MEVSWLSILQALLFGVLFSSLFRWFDTSRLKAQPENKSQSLQAPASVLVLGAAISTSFTVLLILSSDDPTIPLWTKLGFVVLVLAGIPFIWAYFFDRYRVTEHGLEHPANWGIKRHVTPWHEIESTRYSNVMKQFVVRGLHGETARISIIQRGLPIFAEYVLKHAAASLLDETTRNLLEQTAAGDAIPLSG